MVIFLTSKLVANLTMWSPGPPLDTDWLVSALSRDTRRYPLRPSVTVGLTPSSETDNGTSALRSRNRRTYPSYWNLEPSKKSQRASNWGAPHKDLQCKAGRSGIRISPDVQCSSGARAQGKQMKTTPPTTRPPGGETRWERMGARGRPSETPNAWGGWETGGFLLC